MHERTIIEEELSPSQNWLDALHDMMPLTQLSVQYCPTFSWEHFMILKPVKSFIRLMAKSRGLIPYPINRWTEKESIVFISLGGDKKKRSRGQLQLNLNRTVFPCLNKELFFCMEMDGTLELHAVFQSKVAIQANLAIWPMLCNLFNCSWSYLRFRPLEHQLFLSEILILAIET